MAKILNKAEVHNHKTHSFNWFQDIYKTMDPQEISARCRLPYDGSSFHIRIMNKQYLADFPDFLMRTENGDKPIKTGGYDKILFIRFLCEGKFAESTGKQLSYREIPWGDLYFQNFDGRCIQRLARKFGSNMEMYKKIMEEKLNAEKLKQSDAGYRFEFCSGLYMSFLLWAADDEFPASAQILFDDNFPHAFTAEDCAVAGEVALNHMLN